MADLSAKKRYDLACAKAVSRPPRASEARAGGVPLEPRRIMRRKRPMTPKQIEATAHATHEANRAYCAALGDNSQPAWSDAPEWQRSSAINGVTGVLAGNTPEQSHESWLKEKTDTGWRYGAVKDPEKKEHPCFVPYPELPPEQKAKDHVFVGVARAMIAVFSA